MDVQLIPATIASIPQLMVCGRRAFNNDALDHAIFPNRSEALLDSEEVKDFRMNRTRKRMQSGQWHYILATMKTDEAAEKIVGYAGWMIPSPGEQGKLERTEDGQEEQQTFPSNMDTDAYRYATELIEKAKKEILGKEEHRVWFLGSLAVDPDYQGKGIATKLVQWGISKADEDGLPAYLESSRAAVGVYRRLGFKDVQKLHPIKGDESFFLTAMVRQPSHAEV